MKTKDQAVVMAAAEFCLVRDTLLAIQIILILMGCGEVGKTGETGTQVSGGGWGSSGGRGYRGAFASNQCQGGNAGKAVDDSGVSYT